MGPAHACKFSFVLDGAQQYYGVAPLDDFSLAFDNCIPDCRIDQGRIRHDFSAFGKGAQICSKACRMGNLAMCFEMGLGSSIELLTLNENPGLAFKRNQRP